MKYISIVLGGAGFLLLFTVDWKIAVGVFLALWGNNLKDTDI